jgi:O-antigen/teichoic acid export membrane protein
MPRMVKMEAEGDHVGLIRVYRQGTQVVAVIAGAVTITLVFCAEPLLWAWTGDSTLAHQTAPILVLYALGNGIVAVAGFPYLLQYAKGDLRLHLIGNAGFVVALIPSIIWAAREYGALGAGYVWLTMNLIAFVVWLPIVHHKIEPGLNLKWYVHDVLFIYLIVATAGYFLSAIIPHSDSRGLQILIVMGFGASTLLAGAVASSVLRARAAVWLGRCK